MSSFGIIALTPAVAVRGEEIGHPARTRFSLEDASIALAACRASATGIVNLEFAQILTKQDSQELASAISEFRRVAASNQSGIKFDIAQIDKLASGIDALSAYASTDEHGATIILALSNSPTLKELKKAVDQLRKKQLRVFVEVISIEEARLAEAAGADAVIAKGHEAAGRVGEQTTYVLVQQLVTAVKLPVWAQGGIGVHTAAACYVAGVAGVVLESQLFLTPESNLSLPIKQKLASMDGTETALIGNAQKGTYRIFSRAHATAMDHGTIFGADNKFTSTREYVAERVTSDPSVKTLDRVYALGQDIAFAADLTRKFTSVSGIIEAVAHHAKEHVQNAIATKALAEGAPLAVSHGTQYPLVQGAMTRVSDTAEFAFKVADGGALPFLALALMRKSEIDKLLAETQAKLGSLPWGVGILGFVPPELRQEQFEVVTKYKPPFALIAGGRPDQAKVLEEHGIKTYLHVPSPMLLESFIEMGSRKFIFEGRECGGHVGPRSSFILWEAMVEKLLNAIGPKDDASAYHILFAGGVHDGLSAAMVAALAAPLAARGVRVGGLMGTAYLFTSDAVQTGAIVEKFQDAALKCNETVLLETGPGHAIRCIDSPYKRVFDERRTELVLQNKTRDEVREELELMNLGRLRVASKGLGRAQKQDKSAVIAELKNTPDEKREPLSVVPDEQQWADGMYMIGQVAAMHKSVCTIKELHHTVCAGSVEQLDKAEELLRTKHISVKDLQNQPGEPIAIVGMSCLFPKANDVETYWQNILNKVDAITEVPIEQWDWRNYYDKDPLARDKIVSKWGGFLEDIKFDATRYGIPPSSLGTIDPMQLLLLEVSRAALENAGYSERTFERQRTSVIVANAGHGPITALYSLRSMLGWKLSHLSDATKNEIQEQLPEWTEDTFPGYLGNVAAGRVANRFDLGGVNFTVDAACGSSLAALYVGVSELRNGNSDIVLLGATDTHNQPGDFLSFSKTHAFSHQGRCRTFDSTADGIVISEGMAMVVLKRLSDAERDGDRIFAVIKGIGGSSDGRDLSLTAPRPAGQMLALNRAYEDAGLSPGTVSLVEAHGTGTVAGDRAEIEALRKVYEQAGSATRSCAVGSVKTMIGHTKAAAGLASLIKVAKALHHKVLPPTIGVTVPNPACQFESSPFYINSEARPWINQTVDVDGEAHIPRRAGVSAFGFGGTNFHTVLEEYIPPAGKTEPTGAVRWAAELFVLRAKGRNELGRALDNLADSARKWNAAENAAEGLRLLSYSTYLKQLERATESADGLPKAELLTVSIVASSLQDLIEKVQKAKQDIVDQTKSEIKDPKGIYFADTTVEKQSKLAQGKVAYLFSGQGSQHVDMIKELAIHFNEVRDTYEHANAVLRGKLESTLTSYVYPAPAFTDEEKKAQQHRLTATQIAQPAVGAADTGMFKLLSKFGVKADMFAGHSYGEYVALHAAGALTEEDLFKISEIRGRLLSYTNGDGRGSMAAFNCSLDQAKKILEHSPGVTLANINSPTQIVVSGEAKKIENAVALAKKAGLHAKEIAVSQAFHSTHMAHAQAPLRKALEELKLQKPKLPVYSNTNAQPYEADEKKIVEQLVAHIVQPVDFVSELKAMRAAGATIFVEVGPGSVLTGLADAIFQNDDQAAPYAVLSTDRAGRDSCVQLLHALAQLSALGQPIDIERLFKGRISTQDSLSIKAGPIVETGKKGLTYLVNSSRTVRIGATEKPKTKQPQQKTPQAVQLGSNAQTGAPVSAQLKPSSNAPSPQAPSPIQPAAAATGSPSQNGSNGNGTSHYQPALQSVPIASPIMPPAVSNHPAMQPQPAATNIPQQFTTGFPQQMSSQFNGPRNVDQVMLQFQQSMLQMTNSFLETQQRVMLAYLSGKAGAPLPQQTYAPAAYAPQPSVPQSYAPAPYVPQPSVPQSYAPAPYAPQPYAPQPVPTQTIAPPLQTYAAPVNTQPSNGNGFEAHNYIVPQQPAPAAPSNGNGSHPQVVQDAKIAAEIVTAQRIQETSNAAAAPAVESATEATDSDPESLINALLEIVSDRTGYPPDMLDPTLDLEADLGIDSIKRVEILNSFRKILPEAKQLELEGGIEELAGTKTLQGIMDWIRSDAGGAPAKQSPKPSAPVSEPANNDGNNGYHPVTAKTAPVVMAPAVIPANNAAENRNGENTKAENLKSDSRISRALVEAIEVAPKAVSEKKLAAGTWLIVDDGTGIAKALQSRLSKRGRDSVIVKHVPGVAQSSQLSGNLADEAQATSIAQAVRAEHKQLSGLVHLAALGTQDPQSLEPLYSFFNMAKAMEPDLNRKNEHTLLVTAHRLGGCFGQIESPYNVAQAGLAGAAKSLAKEWTQVHTKSIDLQRTVDAETAAELILNEIVKNDPRVEVAFVDSKRFGLQVRPAQINPSTASAQQLQNLQINSDSVVVITGGARGITAEIAQQLASTYRPKLVIVGRSPRPAAEDPSLAGFTSQKELKAAIIDQLKREQKPVSVNAVETIYQKIVRDREIKANLELMERLCTVVEYHAVDVRDEAAFTALINDIYARHGRIDGVVHGAGIIEDAFAKDKTLQSFKRVVETKVLAGFTLKKALRLESLKFLFFFSSVVGRTGNAGQTDYVAANEIVNKLALDMNAQTSARVASIMWGPWRGGMAQPELEALFAKYGWAMIDPEPGRSAFINEIQFGRKQDVEVVIVAEVPCEAHPSGPRLFTADAQSPTPGVTVFTLDMDTSNDLYLNDHTFDGIPVLPMAMATELLMEAAQSAYPGYRAEQVFNMDIPAGIVFERPSKTVTIKTEMLSRSELDIMVTAVLGVGTPLKRTNFKAKVRLIKEVAQIGSQCEIPEWIPMQIDPSTEVLEIDRLETAPPSISTFYSQWMFHGPLFQGVTKLSAIGRTGAFGEIKPSVVSDCLAQTNGQKWAIDPVLLDSAMQLAGSWARQNLDIMALPTGFRTLHKLADSYSDKLYVRVYMDPSSSSIELTCHLAAYNEDGKLAFLMEKLTGVGSRALNRLSTSQAASGAHR